MPAPSNCPSTLLYTTEYNNLFITSGDISGFPALTSDLNFEDFVHGHNDYLVFFMEQWLIGQNEQLRQSLCQTSLNQDNDKINTISAQLMSPWNGDTVEVFHCKKKEAKIKEEKVC